MRTFIFLLILLLVPGALAEVSEHSGFPIQSPASITNAITISDINNDTVPEIIVATLRSAYVYSPTGNLLWNAVAGARTASVTTSPLVADVNGDGLKEVVLPGGVFGAAGTTGFIHRFYIFSSSGGLLKTYELGSGYYPSVPAFADGLILVGITGNYNGLYAYDMTGLKWKLPFAGGSERMNSIAIGDLDGDGGVEAVLAGGGKVTVVNLKASGGSIRWQKDVPGAISPVIINVNGNKIVVASGSSGTFAWDAAGNPVWSSIAASKYYYYAYSSPAVSDIDIDGSDDVITVNDFDVYAISGVNGSILFKASSVTWPPGGFKSRPAVYDINGDSKPEIIIGDSNGNLYIWTSTGALLGGFPVRLGSVLPIESSPAIYDLEGDGIPEVVIGSATNLHVVSVKTKPIIVDTTPPVTTDNADGVWHNSTVTVILSAADDISGVSATHYTTDGSKPDASSPKGTSISLSSDGIYTIKYFSIDKAGNVEPVNIAANKVMIDTTPPATTDDAGTLWHNGSVTVTLKANDPGSGIAATYYTLDGSGLAEGNTITVSVSGTHTIRYYSVDNAGNIEQPHETPVKTDSTPPEAKDDSDNLWHNSDVTINLTASDDQSGIAFLEYTVDGTAHTSDSDVRLTFSEEGIHEISYYGVDNAGNSGKARTAFVKIDKTYPVTTDDADGKWHNGAVTVKLTATDNLSGIRTTGYKVNSDSKTVLSSFFGWLASAVGLSGPALTPGDTISLSDEGTYNIRYYSADNADNTEPEKTSMQVMIDNTPPTIEGTAPPTSNGWYNSDVTVHFTATDALSGLDAFSPDVILSAEGSNQSASNTARDLAGNSASFTVTGINIDKTSPAITGTATTLPNAYGWYNTDVNVRFDCSDDLSGVESCTPDTVISNEGAGLSAAGVAMDNAGNSAETAVIGINIDKTPPALIVNSPQNNTYLHSDIITLGFLAQDMRSGINNVSSTMDGSIQISDGQVLYMLELSFGAHEFTLLSEDKAGNLNSLRVNFNVIATIESLEALTERGSYGTFTMNTPWDSGIWITDNGIANSLMAKIKSAKAKIYNGQKIAAKNIIESYINEVEAQSGKAITVDGAGILVAEATYVIEHL